jgi:pyruvate/2-oxoglutarate dehydrogenase complex dihydrolipoamide acyltransferase (E2) component
MPVVTESMLGALRAPCTKTPFPAMRRFVIDGGDRARRMNLFYFTFQVDVTAPRRRIRAYAARCGGTVSFSAFISYCYARAIDEDEGRRMHAMRKGRQLVAFDEVDVMVIVEKDVEGEVQPVHTIVRAMNKKDLPAVQAEIDRAADLPFEEMFAPADRAFFKWFPRPLRFLVYGLFKRFPALCKQFSGTTCVSSVAMFGTGAVFMLPVIPMTSALTLGGIETRREPGGGGVEQRELLSVALSVDHDVVDGAHAMRFISRFKELVESGHGLPAVEWPGHALAPVAMGG